MSMAQQPVRDAGGQPKTGTASIAGTVVAADATGRPIRQAIVGLVNTDARLAFQAATDDGGRFVFRDLPAGRYSVNVTKAAYVPTTYGAKRAGGPGVPVSVEAGQTATVSIKLTRGAVVAGRITGPGGLPVVGGRVQVLQYQVMNGERRLQPAGVPLNSTDDQGGFRIYGLAAGEYALQVSSLGLSTQETRLVTAAEIEWAQRQTQDASASFGGPPPAAPAPGHTVGIAPVFYPGTSDQNAAQLVKVEAGEERTGLDFAIDFMPTAKLSGVIVDPDGQPPANVQLNMIQPGTGFFASPPVFLRPDREGKFSTTGLLPGQYVLAARGSAASAPIAPSAPTTASNAPVASVTLPLWALADINIDGHDIEGVTLKLQPGMTVSGRVVFEGESAAPSAADLARVRVSLSSAAGSSAVTVGAGSANVSADGSFTLPGVTPSRYRISASYPGLTTSTWTLKSAVVGGRDTQDYPIDIGAGQDIRDVVITFTDHPTQLSGSLLDATGKPAPEYFLVVFSTDKTMWTPNSRRVKLVRPANTGDYKLTGLPAGEYYLCALTDVQPNQTSDPSFLETLIAASIKVTLSDGEKKIQDLKLAGGGF